MAIKLCWQNLKFCVGEANESMALDFNGDVNVLMKGAYKAHYLMYLNRTSGTSSGFIFISTHRLLCTFLYMRSLVCIT